MLIGKVEHAFKYAQLTLLCLVIFLQKYVYTVATIQLQDYMAMLKQIVHVFKNVLQVLHLPLAKTLQVYVLISAQVLLNMVILMISTDAA